MQQIVFQKYIDTVKAMTKRVGALDKQIGSAPQLMAYLGVVPGEHSSGGTQSRGGITKTGNGHVCRVNI